MSTKAYGRQVALIVSVAAAAVLAGCDKSPEDFKSQAMAAIQARDHAAAILHLKNLLAKEPNNTEARLLLARALVDSGDPQGAVIEAKRARELKADDNKAVPMIAEALIVGGEARLLIEQFGNTRLSSPDAQANLASSLALAYLALSRLDKAREVAEAAAQAAPKSPDARMALARVRSVDGKADDAMGIVDGIVAELPNNDEAWAFKGYLLERKGQTDAAQAAYANALKANPKQLEALYSDAMIKVGSGDLKAARVAHERLAKVWPRNPNTLYVDARLTYLEGRYAAARPLFAALLNIAPEHVPTLIASGLNELKLEAPIQAEAQLARAVSLAPTNNNARYLLAQSEIKLGRPDKATAALAPLLEAPDVNAGVLVVAAQAKLLQGDATGADQLFTRAEKLKSTDPSVRTALASARMTKPAEADAALRELEAISQASEATDADLRVISARLARKETKEALAAIAQLEKKSPGLASGPELRGRAALQGGDVAGARKAFEDALTRDKTYIPALAQLVALDMKDGKPDQARKRVESVLAIDKNNSQALVMLASLVVQTGGSPAEVLDLLDKATKSDPLNLNAWMTLLMRHFHAGDFQAAMLVAQSANKAIPDNVQLADLTGRIQMAAGSLNQANSTFAEIIRFAPRSAAGYMGLATALVAGNDLDAAAKVVQRLVALEPTYIDAQRMAGDIAIRQRKYADAMKVAKYLQRIHPAHAAGYLLEAQLETAQNRRGPAIAALRAAVTKTNVQDAPVLLHQELVRSDDAAGAKAFADSWLKQYPKDAAFITYLGDVESEAKNWPAASAQYERALQIDDKLVPALNNAAMAALQQKDSAKALEYVNRALALQPNRPEVLDTLAQVHASRKEYAQATAALRAAIGRATNPSPLQWSLAQIYVAAGDPASAIAELQAIVDRGKTQPLYPAARKQIAELRRR